MSIYFYLFIYCTFNNYCSQFMVYKEKGWKKNIYNINNIFDIFNIYVPKT